MAGDNHLSQTGDHFSAKVTLAQGFQAAAQQSDGAAAQTFG